MRVPKPRESDIQNACRAVLEAFGCRVERRNTGSWTPSGGGKRRVVRFGEVGAADLFGCLPNGRHFELEIKRPGATPRLEQVRWLRNANRWAPAFWVDDAGELERILPALIDGAGVSYLPNPWRFRVKVALPGGSTAHWISEPGGDYDVKYQ